MSKSFINIRGGRQNNLKNISLQIPKNKIIALIGVSGAGKSSLAFDTIFAEGQHRYMESLSLQTRMWIKQLPKPDVDLIEGLSPTLAIGEQSRQLSPRSTVATHTDIYDFLSICYAHFGEQYSPHTNKKLLKQTRQQIIETILQKYPAGSKIQIISTISFEKEGLISTIRRLQKQGFVRLLVDEREFDFSETIPTQATSLEVVVDRIIMKEVIRERLSDSISTALDLSKGVIRIQEKESHYFTEIFVCPESDERFIPLKISDFNFNSPHGACSKCKGKGGYEEIIVDLIDANDENYASLLEIFPRRLSKHYQNIWETYTKQYRDKKHDFMHGNPSILSIETEVGGQIQIIKTDPLD